MTIYYNNMFICRLIRQAFIELIQEKDEDKFTVEWVRRDGGCKRIKDKQGTLRKCIIGYLALLCSNSKINWNLLLCWLEWIRIFINNPFFTWNYIFLRISAPPVITKSLSRYGKREHIWIWKNRPKWSVSLFLSYFRSINTTVSTWAVSWNEFSHNNVPFFYRKIRLVFELNRPVIPLDKNQFLAGCRGPLRLGYILSFLSLPAFSFNSLYHLLRTNGISKV